MEAKPPMILIKLILLNTIVLSNGHASPSQPTNSSYDKEGIRQEIIKNKSAIDECYQKNKQAPGQQSEGKIILNWVIEGDGKATSVKVKETFNVAVSDCLVQSLESWQFPKPPQGVAAEVNYPFRFSSKP